MGTVIREDVIQRASSYATYNWVVNTPNTRYKVYRAKGNPIMGVAYSYGNSENLSSFQSAISGGKIPRNWKANHTWENHFYYTGIDCALLVRDCWGANTQIIDSNCLKINISKIKSGDIVARTGDNRHVQITANQTFGYEAAGYGTNDSRQMVINSPLHSAGDGYTPFSPFPQFSDEDPLDGKIIDSIVSGVDISVTIYGRGHFTTENVSMFVDGIKETNTEIIIKSDTSVQFVAYDSTLNSWSGEVNIEVVARNDILGNGFIDKYNWQFTINRDSTPPKVISTSPQKGEEDVPVDITPITIKFSKPMDKIATKNAITIDPPVNCSTYWESSKKIYLTLDYDTLDYCEEYTITISDAAKDTFGIRLDGDGDGNAGGDCKIKFKTEDQIHV
jgi:hypothetical protein